MDNILMIANEEIARKQSDIEIELRAGRINPTHYQTIIDACAKHGTNTHLDETTTDDAAKYDMTFSIICSHDDTRAHVSTGSTGTTMHGRAREPTIAIRRNLEKGSRAQGLKKIHLASHTVDGAKIVISRETVIDEALPKPSGKDIVRYRARRSWAINIADIPWIIDVTIVRLRTYAQFLAGAQSNGSENKVIQEFKKMVQTRAFDIDDFVEVEMELNMRDFLASDRARDLGLDDFDRVITIMHNDILAFRNDARASSSSSSILLNSRARILRALLQILRPRSPAGTKKQMKLSLKTMLNNARSMDVMQYARTIFPNIGGYFVTGKADGVRGIMVVDDTNKCMILTDSDDIIHGDNECMNQQTARFRHVLDGEVMKSDDKEWTLFLAFDCIVVDGRTCVDRQFSERIALIDETLIREITTACESFATVLAKKYERIDQSGSNIKDVVESIKSSAKYEMDGIIFTQPDTPYSATINFKWKPAHNMTIDFLCIECPRKLYGHGRYQLPVDGMTYAASSTGRSEYMIFLLFCDCTEDQMRGLCINRLEDWREIAESIPSELRNRVIHFSSNFDPLAYIFIVREQEMIDWLRSQGDTTSTSIHGRVVEMRYLYEREHEDFRKWTMIRLRADRVTGNNIAVANSVYASTIAPFTIEMLWEPERGYFDTDDMRQDLVAGNKYRRFVIGAIMSSILVLGDRAHNRILDIGGGRAQDFVRYAAIGAKFVVNYDADKYAIVEGVSRVTSLVRDGGIMRSRAAEHIRSLTRNSKQCTSAIARAIAGGVSTDVASSMQCYAPTYIGRVVDMNSITDEKFKDDLRRIWCEERSFDVVFSTFAFHYFCGSRATMTAVWSIIDIALSAHGIVIITMMDSDAVTELLDEHGGHWGSIASGTKYEIERVADTSRIRVSVPFSRDLREEPLCPMNLLDEVAGKVNFARISTINFSASSMLDLYKSYEPTLAQQMNAEDITYTSLFRTYIYARKRARGHGSSSAKK